jgi:16S rRNA (uracil1498-N3)-methyltransferase
MAERFYTNSPLALGTVFIQGPEAHHLATVCRFRAGDIVSLFNGDGREYRAQIDAAARKQVALTVLEAIASNRELPFRLTLGAPLPKGDRGDFMIEKLTELGVTDFVPLRTERSVVHPRESKLDRLQRSVIEASKQCGRNVLLQIHELTDWREFCFRADLPALRLMAQPGGHSMNQAETDADVCCAVGPEGGFSEEEIALAAKSGWKPVGLGPRTLRVETAALAMALLATRRG